MIDRSDGIKLRNLQFTLGWTSQDEWEDQWRPFDEQVGKTTAIYCCFDPAYGVRRQQKTYFGPLRDNPFSAHVRNTSDRPRFQKELEIRSII